MFNKFPRLEKLKDNALDFIFPRWCVGCGREGDFICLSCRRKLPRITPPICPVCGRPQPSGITCPDCARQIVEIDGIRAPFRFEGAIREAVHQLKYKNIRALDKPLSELMSDYLAANPIPGDVLVPVPLHPKRLRERGYNQSFLLANDLSKLCHLPVVDNCLVRERYVSPQARTATVDERRSNVRGAFTANARLTGSRVLLIDDVSTSGATLDACAGALKSAGVTSVWGLVLAREI